MILVDANLLLYAYHPQSEHHHASRTWLESALSGPELVRFAWMTLWSFLRISTNPRVFEHPLTIAESEGIVASWFSQPLVGILEPGERHWTILQELVRENQTVGPLIMDAALAAIAMEHGAILYSTDRDFSRFSALRWINPLVSP